MARRADTLRKLATCLLAALWSGALAQPASAGRDLSDPLALLPAPGPGGRGVPTEAEWARDLIEALNLEAILPPDADDSERFALLCPDHAADADAAEGRDAPGASPLRVTVPTPEDPGQGGPLRLMVRVPSTALYLFSVEGVGMQRWLLNGHLVGHLDPSPLGIAQASVILPLRAGPYELAATLAPQARADRVEIAAHRSLCIAPADGWHGDRPLTYGVLARTLAHVLGLERELPELSGGIPIRGEDYVESTGGGERSQRRLANDPSSRTWARAAHGPAEFVYRVELETPGLFSLEARLPGGGVQLWNVDGRYRATLRPEGSKNRFGWNTVMTLPLASGQHVMRVYASRDSGIDRIRLVPHAPAGAAYVAVLATAGFTEGAPDAPVSRRLARRSLERMLDQPGAARFLTRYADGTPRGPGSGADGPLMTGPSVAPTQVYRPETWR